MCVFVTFTVRSANSYSPSNNFSARFIALRQLKSQSKFCKQRVIELLLNPSTTIPDKTFQFIVRAEKEEQASEVNQPGFGLGGPGTWFGFGSRQELSVGRLAMIGFAVSYFFFCIHS